MVETMFADNVSDVLLLCIVLLTTVVFELHTFYCDWLVGNFPVAGWHVGC